MSTAPTNADLSGPDWQGCRRDKPIQRDWSRDRALSGREHSDGGQSTGGRYLHLPLGIARYESRSARSSGRRFRIRLLSAPMIAAGKIALSFL